MLTKYKDNFAEGKYAIMLERALNIISLVKSGHLYCVPSKAAFCNLVQTKTKEWTGHSILKQKVISKITSIMKLAILILQRYPLHLTRTSYNLDL